MSNNNNDTATVSNPAELLRKLEAGVEYLTNANPDNCGERNDVGWSARDQAFGHSLAHQVGRWTGGQIKAAWRMLQTYRRTQLAHLDIPVFRDDEACSRLIARIGEERDEAAIAACKAAPGFGLKWGPAKRIDRGAQGVYDVHSAALPQGHPFWTLWAREKESLKAEGYTLRQWDGWQVSRWVKAVDEAPVVAPKLTPYEIKPLANPAGLLPYQVASAERLLASVRAFGAALDASDVGTGKTYVGCKVFQELGVKPLVVAPLAVLPSWQRAAAHFGIEIEVIGWEKVRNGRTPHGKWAGGADGDKKTFVWANVTGLIFDECHRAKSHATQSHRLVAAAKRQGIPTLALSATAATSPLHMKALGYLLGLHQYKGFWRWAESYGCRQSRWGGYEFVGGPEHLRALHAEIFPKKGSRIRVADLGDAFPESQITTELVETADAEKINRAFREVAAAIEAVRLKGATDPEHHLTKLLRARQIAELGKVAAFASITADAVEQGLSVAIFLNFDESITQLRAALEKDDLKVGIIKGGQAPEDRQAAIDAFQRDESRVIIANIKAGGVGVSLHDLGGCYARLSLISPTPSAVDIRQALGRVHRAGGKSKSRQRILFAANTPEERVCKLVEAKLANLDTLNDGDLAEIEGA